MAYVGKLIPCISEKRKKISSNIEPNSDDEDNILYDSDNEIARCSSITSMPKQKPAHTKPKLLVDIKEIALANVSIGNVPYFVSLLAPRSKSEAEEELSQMVVEIKRLDKKRQSRLFSINWLGNKGNKSFELSQFLARFPRYPAKKDCWNNFCTNYPRFTTNKGLQLQDKPILRFRLFHNSKRKESKSHPRN